MSKEVKYYSTDKLYTVSNKRKFNLKLSSKLSFGFILISSAIFLCIATLLFQNSVQLNGKIINELGTKVNPEKDEIYFDDKKIENKEELVYILLNKPIGYVTTAKDQFNRDTVMNLIKIKNY